MKYKALLTATIIATMPLASTAANVKPQKETVQTQEATKTAAVSFVENLNYARLALANKNSEVAHDSLVAAKEVLIKLKDAKAEERVSKLQTNRVNYQEGNANYHYFPIEAGPVAVKKIKTGPFWAEEKGMAVTDAEVVNIVLDLNNENISEHLDSAINDIKNKNFSAAQIHLARISEAVIKEDTATSTPLVKVRDNLSLADSFISHKNYSGARFALKHANSALDQAERDKAYESRKTRITEMKAEMTELEKKIEANDPSALQKASTRIKSWWAELKD